MNRVTDEMLMAFVDGELDRAAADDVRRATERDAALKRRADELRLARRWSKDAFADVISEPVPDRLIEAVVGVTSTVVPLRRRPFMNTALPLAASVAVLFGAAGYWFGQQQLPNDVGLLGATEIAKALEATPSGRTRSVATGAGGMRLETLATYKVDGGVCRSFHLTGADHAMRGVGCSRGGDWRVELAVAAPEEDGYSPASTEALAGIDAFLDAVGAGAPLSAEEEAALRPSR